MGSWHSVPDTRRSVAIEYQRPARVFPVVPSPSVPHKSPRSADPPTVKTSCPPLSRAAAPDRSPHHIRS